MAKRVSYQDKVDQYDEAVAWCKNNGLDHTDEENLVISIGAKAPRVMFDEERIRRAYAASIIDDLCKEGPEAGELLILMGDEYAYNPDQLIKDNAGRVLKISLAPAQFITDRRGRMRKNVKAATQKLAEEEARAEAFLSWTREQKKLGRQDGELLWGVFVAETSVRAVRSSSSESA